MTAAEKAFLTMVQMTDFVDHYSTGPHHLANARKRSFSGVTKRIVQKPDLFPIVASTFEALTIERPELREHYERAKKAWEASQC